MRAPSAALKWSLAAALCRALAMPALLPGPNWLLLFPAVAFRLRGWEQGGGWRQDFLGGLLFWLLSFAFLIHVVWLAPIGAAIILASCWLVEGWLFRLLRHRFSAPAAALLALPCAEFLRMRWFYLGVGGVPWASWGFALSPSPAAALAPVLGEGGLVLLAVALGLLPVALRSSRREGRWVGAVAPVICLLAGLGLHFQQPLPAPTGSLRCLVVQPMIRIDEKHGGLDARSFFRREDAVTQEAFQAGEKPDLVIWGETMWPFAAVAEGGQGLMRRPWPGQPTEERAIADLLQEQRLMVRFLLAPAANRPHFLTGAHFYYPVPADSPPSTLSPRATEFLLFQPDGTLLQHFSKHRLVPFGETLPFGGRWPGAAWLARQFQAGFGLRPDFARTRTTGPLTEVDGLPRLGGAVCWENVFEDTFRMQADAGAQAFLILSNEDWFGLDGIEMAQMVEATRLRAMENGLFMLRATNTGISCLVDPQGRVDMPLPPGETGWWGVDLPLRPTSGWTTPYRAFGHLILPSWSLMAALLLLWAWAGRLRRPQTAISKPSLDPAQGLG